MNVLAHRIASEVPSRRLHAVRMPRAVRMLGASLVATTLAMSVLQRVAERIG